MISLRLNQKILSKGIKYTKNGFRLMSKSRCDVSSIEAVKSPFYFFSGYKDVVQLETNFGKGKKIITSYYDTNDGNKLVGRIIQEYDGPKEISTVVKSYSRNESVVRIKTNLTGADKSFSNSEEILYTGNPQSISKYKYEVKPNTDGSRIEHQFLGQYTCQEGCKKFIETSAKRMKTGELVDQHVATNLKNSDEITKSPYLFMLNYNKKDFANTLSHIAAKLQKIGDEYFEFTLKKLPGSTNGYYRESANEIVVDINKASSSGLVNTINHEVRHKYQHVQRRELRKSWFNIFRRNNKKVNMSKTEREFALKSLISNIFYVPSGLNYKLYFKNFLEVDARKTGAKFQQEFINGGKKLSEEFKFPVDEIKIYKDISLMDDLYDAIKKSAKTVSVGLFGS